MLDRHSTALACTAAMLNRGWSNSRRADDQPEIEANRWAADLLMPEHLFAPMVADSPITLDAARDLTRWFHTRLIATAICLVRFGTASSMIIWNRPGQRYKWLKRSPYMPASVWPRPQPGPGTVAYKLMRGERQKPGPQTVRWDEWINLENLQLSYVMEDVPRCPRAAGRFAESDPVGSTCRYLTPKIRWVFRHTAGKTFLDGKIATMPRK